LEERGVETEEINYAKKPLDADTIAEIIRVAGGVGKVLNPRHEIAKSKGWVESPPRDADFIAAATKEPNLLRRPILVRGKTVLVGYDKSNEEKWGKL
jgi:arsenate reductase-like glutaredoxin family protein